MIVTELYEGQGLGNQLWCYVTTRVIALSRGLRFGIQSPERFKGIDFMDLDFGDQVIGGRGPQGGPPIVLPHGIARYHRERSLIHPDGSDIRTRDEKLMSVPDGTKIDGCLQDASALLPYRDQIREWLRIRPEHDCRDYSSDDVCVINFRGGGYARDKAFFLPQAYWDRAIERMRAQNPRFRFVVVTDDPKTAKPFFPDFEVVHFSIAKDYSIILNAHHLIVSNSSFAWFPAWLGPNVKTVIAPKYWARHNTSDGYWSLGYSITPGWTYLDRDGTLTDADTCQREADEYMRKNAGSVASEATYTADTPYVPPAFAPAKATKSLRAKLSKAKARASNVLRRIAQSRALEPISLRMAERRSRKGWRSPADIAAYRKTIRIYDVFTFFNELDLLEIRLNILDPFVDYFVLIEATKTFSGHPKPLHYLENKHRFKKWNHKIIHYVVDDAPDNEDELRSRIYRGGLTEQERLTIAFTLRSHTVGLDTQHWFREFYIKESSRKALDREAVGDRAPRDNDVCYVSDLDEIWNPELAIDYSKDNVFKPIQKPYAYFLNNRTNENWRGWTGTVVTKYKNIRGACLNHLRTHKLMERTYSYLRNGGWHFTFQGGYEGAKRKIDDSKHFWYDPTNTLPNLRERILKNKDFRGRNVRLWRDERGLPKYLLENRETYRKFFK